MPTEAVSGPNNDGDYDVYEDDYDDYEGTKHANVKPLVKEKAMVYSEICGASSASVPKESIDGISNNSGTPALSNSDSIKMPVKSLSTNFDDDSHRKYDSTAHEKVKFAHLASVGRSSGTGKKMQPIIPQEYKPEKWMLADQESGVLSELNLAYHGSKPRSLPDQGQTSDGRLSHYSVCSPSRGFSDLIHQSLNNRNIIHKVNIGCISALRNHIEHSLYNGGNFEEVNTRCTISPTMASLTGSLVEICEVYANFPFVGTILVCDEHSSKTLYYRDDWTTAYRDFMLGRNKWVSSKGNAVVDFKEKLKLTGPSRATTTDNGFVIKAFTPATRRKSRDICKIVCNANDSRMYNKLKTCIMKMDRGCIFLTYSVLPKALQASVIVGLRLPPGKCYPGAKVYGHITAVIDKFGIASTLFSKDAKEAVPLGEPLKKTLMDPSRLRENEGYKTMRLPLTRSVLAVPFGERLQMIGTLQLCLDDAPIDINDAPIDINYSLWIGEEECETPYYGNGESFTNVRMSLRPVF